MSMMEQGGFAESAIATTRRERTQGISLSFLTASKYRSDILALTSLLVLGVAAVVLRMVYDNWLSEPDLITFFIPWFGFIGDQLREGSLPVWSNNYLGGIPVIGSPSSGWLYLPVMLLFPFLQVTAAIKALVLVQVLIAGFASYVLARRIELQPTAAFAASAAFILGPLIYESTRYTLVGSQVTTWIPVGLVAVDFAMSTRRIPSLLGWSALAGLAMSQIIVAWPGQGILYGAMWIGAWMAYRCLFSPFDLSQSVLFRLWWAFWSGVVLAVSAFGLSAAAFLPILNISEQSTIPGGDYSNVLGGDYASVPHQFKILLYYLFSGGFNVRAEGFGAAIVALAILGALLARRRYAAVFFASVLLIGLSLSVERSPTQWLFNFLPGFEHFHGHRPIAIVWILSLAPAMLVGAAVQVFINQKVKPFNQVVVLSVLVFCTLMITQVNTLASWIGWSSFLGMLAVITVFWLPSTDIPIIRKISPEKLHSASLAVLLLVIVMLPTGYDAIRTIRSPESPVGGNTKFLGKDDFTESNVNEVLSSKDPGTAAEFLQQQAEVLAPFRFTSYSGQGYPTPVYQWVYNTFWYRRMEPNIVGLLVNARTLRLGLEQTSGYNPVQLRPYVEYIDIMNMAKQDYHWSDTYESAITARKSPLLDMLNVRYILVDIATPIDRADHAAIREKYPEVFRDQHVIVYENTSAFPRAWLAHSIYANEDGEGLEALQSGQFNGHSTAFVDGDIPQFLIDNNDDNSEIGRGENESVTVVDLQEDSMKLRVTAEQDGLVVVSASYADGWVAYVDGRKTDVLRTNQAFQGVAVTAGDHLVELRYQPRSLEVGLFVTGFSTAGVIVIWSWAAVDNVRRGNQSGSITSKSTQSIDPDTTS